MDQQHFDIVIIGAGLSGIGTACHIAREFPNKTLAILERRENMGGTWDLFKYPGIRSDSDMASYGFNFKPWYSPKVLARGGDIRNYVVDTAKEFGLYDKIHYGLKLSSANWSSKNQEWVLSACHENSGEERTYRCGFIVNCAGYYNFDHGFRPHFEGEENFKGQIIHPQHWPEDLEYKGKKVVVIGSGATAVTVVPSMASEAAKVTMLQRSPSYIMSLPDNDKISTTLNKFLPKQWVFKLARNRNILFQRGLYLACQRWPERSRKLLISHMHKQAPNIDIRHFSPEYMPWDQRLCAAPDGDFFEGLRSGKTDIVTDNIVGFDETGIVLQSGQHLKADIIVTATGLDVQLMGGLQLELDDKPVPLPKKMTYKGLMIQDIPNYGWIFGYTNAPWTLKSDIGGKYLCRLLNHMDKSGYTVATPMDKQNNITDVGMLDEFAPGYIKRAKDRMPRQGKNAPWKVTMHYGKDKKILVHDPIDDGILEFRNAVKVQSRATADQCKETA